MLPSDDSDDEDAAEDDESEVMIAAGKKNEQRSLIAHYGRELIRSAAQLLSSSQRRSHSFQRTFESRTVNGDTVSIPTTSWHTEQQWRHRRDPPCDIHIHIHSHSHTEMIIIYIEYQNKCAA